MTAAPKVAPKRTSAQSSRIWGILARLVTATGLGKDEWEGMMRAEVKRISGQEHTSQLSQMQAARLIGWLETELQRYARAAPATPDTVNLPVPRPHPPFGERAGPRADERVTPMQQQVLRGLWDLCARLDPANGWSTAALQQGFSRRQCGRPWPQSEADADKLIAPLASIAARQGPMTEWARRVAAILDAPELDAWKRKFIRDVNRQLKSGRLDGKDDVEVCARLPKIVEAEDRVAERPG